MERDDENDNGDASAGCGADPARGSRDGRRASHGVRVRVRGDEIVIEIDRRPAARRGGRSALDELLAPDAVTRADHPRRRDASHARGAARAAGVARVGLTTVAADRWDDGYRDFALRADLAESYRAVYEQVRALGGVITSSGGLRDLREPATAGRSKTSLHYTGRALDLYIYSGMQGGPEPYLVTRAGGTDARPEWTVYCASGTPIPSHPLYDASLLDDAELECVKWVRGVGAATYKRRVRHFSLTDVFARQGWVPIPARGDWRENYLSCEWWHFQNERGLVPGVSTLGDELLRAWPAAAVAASGLAAGAVWAGRSFRLTPPAAGAPAPAAGAAADPSEKVRWAQTVLVSVAGEPLTPDGTLGPRTAAALQRFQMRNGLRVSGEIDASSEVALIQRALEKLGAVAAFPRVGVLDDATVHAVERFQAARKLRPDGRVGAKTRAAIVDALVTPSAKARIPRGGAPPRRARGPRGPRRAGDAAGGEG